VIRILDESSDLLRLESVGLSEGEQTKVKEMLSHRKGLILVTGPTGSGKTTSLYAMLNQINQTAINIITVENPIEYHLPGVTQVQINSESGLTFATALRSILRQDPNVILIGEIRDSETAQIAMRAALTGHLVISTLHTNDAPSAVNRLFDLGIPNFMISSLLIGVIAQRLIRQICPECKVPVQPTDEEKKALNVTDMNGTSVQFYKGNGCKSCHQSGLKGRSAVYEILKMNSKLREVLSLNPTEQQFKAACRDAGFVAMKENAFQMVLKGVTTYSEVIRCIGIDENLDTLCGNCDHLFRAEYLLCPNCGEKPKNKCPQCNKIVQLDWKYCPYCEKSLEKSLA
jgi:type II secretory ATPase GspE/PulE/Tfp pilus assembly ATPase PilB-like protein